VNVAYKHLDSKLRIGELTVLAWIGVILGVACGIAWGVYISPFGPTLTLTLGIYVAALPIGAAVLASVTEFDPWLIVRSAVAWRRLEGRFVPGGGDCARGYLVVEGSDSRTGHSAPRRVHELDLGSLWGAS
jgi:hypothetical protein